MEKNKVLLLYTDKYYLIKQVYPFGLDLIANYLLEFGYEVTVDYPFLPDPNLQSNLASILDQTTPNVIGLGIRNLDTCMSCEEYGDYGGDGYNTFYFLPEVKRVVEFIKNYAPGVPIVAGGGAFTISPEQILRYLGLEYGIVGEGEEPLRRFIEAFPEKKGISKIPNLVYYDHGYIANPRYYYPFNNKLMPFERDGRFNYAFETTGLPIQVKRGCNQRCSYCVEPFIEGRRYIFRDIDQVIEELKAVSQSHDGIRTVFFVDTEFNLPDLTYCSRLVKRIIEEGLHEHFRFSSQFLPGPFDPEFANLLAKAGFNIIFTCDSFADDVLEKNRVSYRQEDIIMTLKLCEEYGIGCTISMIFGLPGETYETVDQSIGQMKRFPPNFLRRYEYTVGGRIYQGTALSRFIEKEGGKGHLYGVKSEGYLEPYYFCSLESPLGLKEYIEKASDYRIAYDNCYDEIRFRTLALGYLADQGKWEEATSLFFKSDLSVQSSIYQYLFRKLTGAGRAKDAKLVSENLLLVIQDNGASSRYSDQTDLIRFYLSCLG